MASSSKYGKYKYAAIMVFKGLTLTGVGTSANFTAGIGSGVSNRLSNGRVIAFSDGLSVR